MKRHSLVQISMFFKKTNFTLSKSIYFHFKMPPKSMVVIFRTRMGRSLIWQNSSERPTLSSEFLISWFCNEKFCTCSWQRLIVHQKTRILFKKIKISEASNLLEFIVFLWNIAHVFSLTIAMPVKKCEKIVLFLNW